jgi:nicotinamidase-related amidase
VRQKRGGILLRVFAAEISTTELDMPDRFSFDPAHTALLSMDCQTGIVSIYVKEEKESFLARVCSVLDYARASGITVIHVRVGFRPGLPEVSSRNLLFSSIRSSPQHQALFQEPLGAIAAAIAPKEGDIVITKHRVSAFTGTDLAMILRAKDVDTLVLFGIATSGVVLSTLLEAVDGDFRLAVVKDCCADLDASLHDCLINRFFPTRASVLLAREFTEGG